MTKQTATDYNVHNGRNTEKMSVLLNGGEVPLSIAGFMQHRAPMLEQLGDVYMDTSDLVAYGGRGNADEIKMILTVDAQGRITDNGRQALELINLTQKRVGGAIDLSEVYDGMQGEGVVSLSRKELKKHGVFGDLDEAQVLNHPFWRVSLRHPDAVSAEFAYDAEFMNEAVGRIFAEMKERHGYTKGMGVYPDEAGKVPKMRSWFVNRLYYRSNANGRFGLDNGNGRLVGVAPEAQGVSVGFLDIQEREAGNGGSSSGVEAYTPAQISEALGTAELKGIESILFNNLRGK